MVTIKYFDGGKTIDLEVTEEFAEAYKELCREDERLKKQEQRRRAKTASLEQLREDGIDIVDERFNPLERAVRREDKAARREKLKAAFATLTLEQKKLVKLLKEGMGIREIARVLGKDPTSVRDMKEAIQKKLEKFL